MRTSNVTKVVYLDQTETPPVPVICDEKKWEDIVKEASEKSEAPPDHAKQTFVMYEAETPEDFAILVPNVEEQVNLFNRGVTLKQHSFVRGELESVWEKEGFQIVDGAYDLATVCAEQRERRKATPTDKAKKILAGLSPEELATVLAQFQQAATATQ